MQPDFASRAIVMSGVVKNYIPGALIYKDGSLRLVIEGRELFNTPLSGIQKVKWPWLQFGWGCSIWVDGKKYAVTFARSAGGATGSEDTSGASATFSNYVSADAAVKALMAQSASDGPKTIGKKWKAVFSSN